MEALRLAVHYDWVIEGILPCVPLQGSPSVLALIHAPGLYSGSTLQLFIYCWQVRRFDDVFVSNQAARAGGALLLAPIVDKGLTGLQRTLHLKSRRAAFLCTIFACLGIAAALFGTVVVLHT